MMRKLSANQRLDDALSDAETFVDSTLGELEETSVFLRKAKKELRMKRLGLARLLKKEGLR